VLMISCKPLIWQITLHCSLSLGLFCTFHQTILPLMNLYTSFWYLCKFHAFNSSALSFCNFFFCQLGKPSGWLCCASDLGIGIFLSTLDASNSIGSDLAHCVTPTCCFTILTNISRSCYCHIRLYITCEQI
jgi:hypothetical protein